MSKKILYTCDRCGAEKQEKELLSLKIPKFDKWDIDYNGKLTIEELRNRKKSVDICEDCCNKAFVGILDAKKVDK